MVGLKKGQTNSGSFKKDSVPWNKGKCNSERICVGCKKKFVTLNCYEKKYCNQKCYLKHFVPPLKGTVGIAKPNSGSFKKGRIPWSYIDGRSKTLGPARYGDDWFKVRLLIYKRDNFTCQECGINMNEAGKPHHIHHKIPFLTSFDNSPKNLITLCPSCHRREDARLIKQMKMEA